ncbi:MAG: tRNA (adenosine(37)-N6)-dimethylallyltransferase MiaA [Oscillospiraceae bacterium]|nr:tRNA (adenosine(37)-N6)-dimethylallyltransferase MiaA [Oscillospiraceae bacterium]
MTDKVKIIVICGPTASGKTHLAADVAGHFNGEVVNADSMQVYRGMDIATAMPTHGEKQGIPHHLFAIIEPDETFSVADWLILAREKIAEITSRGKLPVIAGGTGLYINSLIDNITFDDIGNDTEFREKMYKLAEEKGNSFLLEMLRSIDPEAASNLHENNVKRVIRALETHKSGGLNMESRLELSRKTPSPYNACVIGINFESRQTLYDRINRRVDIMLENGLLNEAIMFNSRKTATASQAIGHKELLPHLKNEAELNECVEILKMRTRNYAKRQLTWFRKVKGLTWFTMKGEENYCENLKKIINFIENF